MENDPFFKTKRSKQRKRKAGEDLDDIPSDDEPSKRFQNGVEDSDDESDHETAGEKRLRLAKEWISELEEQEADASMGKDDISKSVSLRLRDDLMEQRGQLQRDIADRLQDKSVDPSKIIITKGHRLPITCVALTADNKHFVTGSKDGAIIKWARVTGIKMHRWASQPLAKRDDKKSRRQTPHPKSLVGHVGAVFSIAVSTDSQFLASAGMNQLVYVWNFQSHELLRTFRGHRGPIYGLAFRRSTHQLFSGSEDRTIKVWNLDEMTYVETLFGHQDAVTAVASMHRERAVSSGGRDFSVRLWKIPEESQLVYLGHKSPIDCVAMITEVQFVSGCEDGTLNLWDVSKKKPTCTVKSAHGHGRWICSVAAVPFGDIVASGSHDGHVRIWRIGNKYRSLSQVMALEVNGFVNGLQFALDGTSLVAGTGKEHRLGRWMSETSAKNQTYLFPLDDEALVDPAEQEADDDSDDEEQTGSESGSPAE